MIVYEPMLSIQTEILKVKTSETKQSTSVLICYLWAEEREWKHPVFVGGSYTVLSL